ncbi:D-aminoacyl-tRNA deacylase [uncultured archaeon]|nr:D-aminoacyl-tRNA deacylase [uncultured archaeon]
MLGEVAIICSRADPASLNIFEHLQRQGAWQERDGYSSLGRWRLIIHDEKPTALQGVDGLLANLGLEPEAIVFACRHEAKASLPWLGGHFTGVLEKGNRELSAAAPRGLCTFLRNVISLAPPNFAISAEATHHGPTDVATPCFFAEIGSTPLQWRNDMAGEAVARAILSIKPDTDQRELPVFLGFGGGHYVQRQTELLFNAEIAFGHLFSSYQVGELDGEIIEEARRKSGACYAYLDRKSLRSEQRKGLVGLLEELDLPMLKSKEIRDKFPSGKS